MLALACGSTGFAAADDVPVISTQSLRPAVALELALATQAACREKDLQVSVAVVERSGIVQVILRDELAGSFTPDIALLKARTAAGFRQPTLALGKLIAARPELGALQQHEQILMVGGGVPVAYNGSVVGAIGVSGAPTPESDHGCAMQGLDAMAERLMF